MLRDNISEWELALHEAGFCVLMRESPSAQGYP